MCIVHNEVCEHHKSHSVSSWVNRCKQLYIVCPNLFNRDLKVPCFVSFTCRFNRERSDRSIISAWRPHRHKADFGLRGLDRQHRFGRPTFCRELRANPISRQYFIYYYLHTGHQLVKIFSRLQSRLAGYLWFALLLHSSKSCFQANLTTNNAIKITV